MIIAQIPDREKNDPHFGEGGREMSPKAATRIRRMTFVMSCELRRNANMKCESNRDKWRNRMSEAIRVLCPWCHRGEVYIEGDGNAHVSIMCARCAHCFRLRLSDFSTVRIQPRRSCRKRPPEFTTRKLQSQTTIRTLLTDRRGCEPPLRPE